MKYLLFIILFFLSDICFAAVYMQKDNGNTTYSDTPAANAQPITIPPPTNNISLPAASSQPNNISPQPKPEESSTNFYKNFTMIDPTDEETFQNQRDIPITIKMGPALREGDKIQLFLDGNPVGQPTSDLTQLAIHEVERGEHQLFAALIDKDGQTVEKTSPVTIYIHYSAIPTGSGAIKTNL